MELVSADYKNQIRKTLRNPSYLRVTLKVTDPDAYDSSLFSSSGGEMFYSTTDDIKDNPTVATRLATLEHNKFILDGSLFLPPKVDEPPPTYQGYVNTEVSDVDGYYTTAPTMIIDFSTYVSFAGLTLIFDKLQNTFPSEIEIASFLDDVEIDAFIIYPDKAQYTFEHRVPSQSESVCNKIELRFIRSNLPFRRIVVAGLIFGLTKEFEGDTIVSSTWERDVDLLSTKLPKEKFEFSTLDVEGSYDPGNAEGMWQYIEARQPVLFEYGYELDSGNIEWVEGGNLLTDGSLQTRSEGAILEITFGITSWLLQLTNVYHKGEYSAVGKTLYDLAEEVCLDVTDSSFRYYIDPALVDTITRLPIPRVQIREALQLIANAGRAVLYTDRSGKVVMKRFDGLLEDFSLDLASVKNIPSISKVPLLHSVETGFLTEVISEDPSELTNAIVDYSVETELQLTYSMATDLSYTVDGVTVHGVPELYAETAIFRVSGTGKIIVLGKSIELVETKVTEKVNTVGYVCPAENSLLNNEQSATNYAQWIADVLRMRNIYNVDDRGFPEIDALDRIKIDTLSATDVEAIVLKSLIKYNGALSGSTEYVTTEVGDDI